MNLYHGSAFKQTLLKPGIKHTGVRVVWDNNTESNEWLYASSSKRDAVILGFFSLIEKQFDGTEFNFEGKKIAITAKQFDCSGLVVYLYKLEYTSDWVKVNNKYNHSTTEYKTQDYVVPLSVTEIDIGEYLKRNGYRVILNGKNLVL